MNLTESLKHEDIPSSNIQFTENDAVIECKSLSQALRLKDAGDWRAMAFISEKDGKACVSIPRFYFRRLKEK